MGRSAFTSLAELAAEATEAHARGIEYLIDRTLPSCWTTRGRGWQELWDHATSAGVYASCDGLLLLSQALPRHSDPNSLRTLMDDVYEYHLCAVLDKDVVATTEPQTRMRAQTLGLNLKMAKFVQASAVVNPSARHRCLVEAVKRRLLRERNNDGLWRSAAGDASGDPSAFASAECAIALHMLNMRRSKVVTGSALSLVELAAPLAHALGEDGDWSQEVVAGWAVSELLAYLNPEVVRRGAEALKQKLDCDSAETEPTVDEQFLNRASDSTDYYRFNTRLLLAKALLNYIVAGALPSNMLRDVLPDIDEAIRQIGSRGFYRRPNSHSTLFWEFYQAMDVLDAVIHISETNGLSEGGRFMYVDPKIFRTKKFVDDPNLVVVLMPFTPTWATDAFNAFEEAVTSKGMTVWRSDKEFRDDLIMETIWQQINSARFVIADCTGRNPNVFYELGMAHVLGKTVFICAQKGDDIPFDIHSVRHFVYGMEPTPIKRLKSTLQKFIDEL